MRKIIRVGLPAVGAWLVLGIAAGPADAAGDKPDSVKTKLTIQAQCNLCRGAGWEFTGKVKSKQDKCTVGRSVRLYFVTGGPDTLIDSTVSDDAGRWAIEPAGKISFGDYYVESPKAKMGSAKCLSGESKRTSIPLGRPG